MKILTVTRVCSGQSPTEDLITIMDPGVGVEVEVTRRGEVGEINLARIQGEGGHSVEEGVGEL